MLRTRVGPCVRGTTRFAFCIARPACVVDARKAYGRHHEIRKLTPAIFVER